MADGATTPIRVMVIEDAADLRLLLRFALGLEPGLVVVDAVPSVAAASAGPDEVDVVLVDHHMTTSRRRRALQSVSERWPAAGIVLAGSRLDPHQLAECETAGVAAFLQTRGDVSEAAGAIRTAAARRPR